jgi:hypothetical protein
LGVGVEPIGPRRLGYQASGSGGAWLVPPAGHPLQHVFPRTYSDATPKHRNNAMRCICVGEERDGAGLRPSMCEGTHVARVTCWRYQPSGDAPRGLLPQTPRSYRLHPHTPLLSLHPGPVLPIFQFAPVGNTENFLVRGPSRFSDSGFRSTLKREYLHALTISAVLELHRIIQQQQQQT